MSCGADTLATTLINNLTNGMNFTIPDVNLTDADVSLPTSEGSLFDKAIAPADIKELTTKEVGGTGSFDVMMSALTAHLEKEYKAGRITGAEYTKVYIANAQLAMQTAVAWHSQRDQSYWNAVTAQVAAMQGRIALKTAAVDLATARVRSQTMRAEYAVTALRAANEDAQYCNNTLQADVLRFNVTQLLPAQLLMTKEQMEAARAQTMDSRTDGVLIGGSVAAQKDLYRQQILSYKRSAELNAARVFTDAWISIKAVDEGINIPGALTSDSVSGVLSTLKANNQL